MSWRTFSRVLWPGLAAMAGAGLAGYAYGVIVFVLLNAGTRGVAVGLVACVGIVPVMFAGAQLPRRAVARWFD